VVVPVLSSLSAMCHQPQKRLKDDVLSIPIE
jgi:hypothetical protein